MKEGRTRRYQFNGTPNELRRMLARDTCGELMIWGSKHLFEKISRGNDMQDSFEEAQTEICLAKHLGMQSRLFYI